MMFSSVNASTVSSSFRRSQAAWG